MERCEIIRDLLPVYIDGLASEETAKLVEEHLAECEACRLYVAQILQMKEAFPDAEEEEVPDGFAEGVMTAIRAKAARAGVCIASSGSPEAKAALAAGRPLITVDGTGGKPNVKLGWWWMGRQVGTALAQHPALAALPQAPDTYALLKDNHDSTIRF